MALGFHLMGFCLFREKLMRVSKGRPIGASAADKVLEKFYMTNGGAA